MNMESPENASAQTEHKSTEFRHKQTDRLKREDEEEQWISGEELYTDGSSDEEGKKGVRRKHKRDHKGARPKEKSLSKNCEMLPKPALVVPTPTDSDGEEPVDISWKPKRGSIKLPHMTKELDLAPSSTSTSAEPITE